MKNILKAFTLTAVLVFSAGCDLDLLDNPNELTLAQSRSNFLLNQVQIGFANFFISVSEFGMQTTRMVHMGGENYTNAYQPVSFDNTWNTAYVSLLRNIRDLKARTVEENLPYHSGVAKVLEAYVLVTLVDYFGRVPYSQALDTDNFNPGVDDGAVTYNRALRLLSEANTELSRTGVAVVPPQDLFFTSGTFSPANWRRVANTLKLRIFVQRRLVDNSARDSVNFIVANRDIIDVKAEDFQFNYPANSFDNPNNYHPWFMENYQVGAAQYMSNYFMDRVLFGKSIIDPRRRYYFYRQTTSTPTDVNVLGCVAAIAPPPQYPDGMVYCFVTTSGYFGRDHLDPSGIPPDNLLRTIYGLYPAGGAYDRGEGVRGRVTSGAAGRGILPIMTASFTSFLRAEAALTLGTTGTPAALLQDAITKSIDKVLNFNTAVSTHSTNPSTATVNAYINEVIANYNAATTNDERLDIIGTEFWIALFGNGVDSYNLYRRTGKPAGMQPALTQNPGTFIRSFYYPSVFVNRNSSTAQKTTTGERVFWDTNPVNGFIN
jgi:hypothetical protein